MDMKENSIDEISEKNKTSVPNKNIAKSKEYFESIPLVAACLTYLGFYFLMLLGFLNQLLFTPKVATEENRQVLSLLNSLNGLTTFF